jgi:hypothetical protein
MVCLALVSWGQLLAMDSPEQVAGCGLHPSCLVSKANPVFWCQVGPSYAKSRVEVLDVPCCLGLWVARFFLVLSSVYSAISCNLSAISVAAYLFEIVLTFFLSGKL